MSGEESKGSRTREERRARRRERRPELTRWKVVLLGVAGLFVVVGFALSAMGGGDGASEGSAAGGGTSGGGAAPNGFVTGVPAGGDPEAAPAAEDEGAAAWSPFFLKGGFSFVVAFCVGYAARVWLGITAAVVGTFFVGVFLLSYFGALDVDWTTLQGWWDSLAARAKDEASDFHGFVTGSLPQAGLAGLGLLAGFKRR